MQLTGLTRSVLLIGILVHVTHSQTTMIFWADQGTSNGKIQSAELDGSAQTTLSDNLNMPCGLAIDEKSDPAQIYYCIRGDQKIVRSNLDGSGQEDVITDIPGIRDIELDLSNRKIYWVRDTYDDDAVQRADMDGLNSNIEELYTSSYANYGFYGIGLDHKNQTVYWTQANNGCQDKIRRINFDGTGFTNVIVHPQNSLLNPWDIDVAGNKIYWTDCGLSEDIIYSADLDGSNIDTVITEVDCQFFTIDTLDWKLYWTEDYAIGSSNLDGSERTQIVTGLGGFLMGIGLAHNVPSTFIESSLHTQPNLYLLDNYPNPFNPRTRVRYLIPADGSVTAALFDVSLNIYNSRGQMVVRLLSEKQRPGRYQVEWDARGFSSGVYFCRLDLCAGQAPVLTRTLKMILLQ